MNREQLKDAYQKIYAWMTILNMHDIFTDDNDKPNYPLIGKVWTNQKAICLWSRYSTNYINKRCIRNMAMIQNIFLRY